MSAVPDEETSGQAAALAPEPAPSADGGARSTHAATHSTFSVAVWLVGILAVVIAAVALSPFWASAVAPLLPWGNASSSRPADYAALAARVDAIEQRPNSPNGDVDAVRSAEAAVAQRLDRLEARGNTGDAATAVTAMQTTLQHLEQRLAATDAQAASSAAGTQKLQQEVVRLNNTAVDLATRLVAIENQSRSQARADRADLSLLLALIQLRQAVGTAQPFAAEYDAFAAFAHDRPELVTAAAPLAESGGTGVASDAMLKARLAELMERLGEPASQPATDWWGQTLVRLRSLVTIRRIDNAGQTGPEAAIGAAQVALEHGDLPKSIGALGPLSGADAEAAAPWLRLARQRVAAETALTRLQQLLAAGMAGAPPVRSANPPAQAPAKSAPPVKTGAPS